MHVNLEKEPVGEVRAKCLDLAGDAELLFMEGFDEAILGVGEAAGNPPVVVYDRQAVLNELMRDLGGPDQAREYFDHNIRDAFVGSGMPVIVDRLP